MHAKLNTNKSRGDVEKNDHDGDDIALDQKDVFVILFPDPLLARLYGRVCVYNVYRNLMTLYHSSDGVRTTRTRGHVQHNYASVLTGTYCVCVCVLLTTATTTPRT